MWIESNDTELDTEIDTDVRYSHTDQFKFYNQAVSFISLAYSTIVAKNDD